jgi:hypothetical protein
MKEKRHAQFFEVMILDPVLKEIDSHCRAVNPDLYRMLEGIMVAAGYFYQITHDPIVGENQFDDFVRHLFEFCQRSRVRSLEYFLDGFQGGRVCNVGFQARTDLGMSQYLDKAIIQTIISLG